MRPRPRERAGPHHAPRPEPRGAWSVLTTPQQPLCHARFWRRSNERWRRKPERGACGGVVGKLHELYIHIRGL